jgi:hypothetical protein
MSLTIPGRDGGLATVRKYGTKHMSRIGRRGGLEVVDKYGTEFMSLIGTLGNDNVNGTLAPSRRSRIEGRIRKILRENQ